MIVKRRQDTDSTWVDVFDRVLDKGIVIDAWERALSLGGIDLAVNARIVVVDACLEMVPVDRGSLDRS
jgi:gas vesicle protein GvpA/GvpJ/GvpM family